MTNKNMNGPMGRFHCSYEETIVLLMYSDGVFLLVYHQVVLKALDPVFEIEDPYAYNIQGNGTLTRRPLS